MKNEMGGARSTYMGEKMCIQGLWENLQDPGLNGRIILKWIFEKWDRSMDYMDLD